jgi:hypothetical protein
VRNEPVALLLIIMHLKQCLGWHFGLASLRAVLHTITGDDLRETRSCSEAVYFRPYSVRICDAAEAGL